MTTSSHFDTPGFRNALGCFATGVTIITTRETGGAPIGITANSFNSVSLDPPMVLWSLAKSARSLPIFDSAEHWAIHILSAHQQALSSRFAKSGADKFADIAIADGAGGVPLLHGCSARLQCRTSFKYEGGDHIIFVGEVLAFDRSDEPPLVFHSGRYALTTSAAETQAPRPAASWSEDHLGYLLGRSYFQVYRGIAEHVRNRGLSDAEYFLLATLIVRDACTLEQANAILSYTGCAITAAMVNSLAARGLLQSDDGQLKLTPQGRETTLHLVAAAQAVESDVLGKIGDGDTLALKSLLARLVNLTDPGLPDLWNTSRSAA